MHTAQVDASLDTEKVRLVAALLKKKVQGLPHVKYIMVSHRPEMYEFSDQIAGIYTVDGCSRIVTQAFAA